MDNVAPNLAEIFAGEAVPVHDPSVISRPPTHAQRKVNTAFGWLTKLSAWFIVGLVAFIIIRIAINAGPAVSERGFGFLTGTTWDPNAENFSILPEIWGTLYSSLLALLIGTFFGVAVAIFLSEGFLGKAVFQILVALKLEYHPLFQRLPDQMENILKNLIELLAAIPSVIYGLWGLFVVIPMIRPMCAWLTEHLGWLPFFNSTLSGPGMLPAALVLAIMILPTITAISRHALVSVPPKLRMAAYGLGATQWETILAVILPTAARGIFGAVVLAFGRALGETMALAMLAGNRNTITVSLFSPANTLAALLANNFPEAGAKEVPVLMYAALVLLLITLLVNVAGAWILQRASGSPVKGGH